MPAYDFQCLGCGKLFETRLTMTEFSDGKRPHCPDCGAENPTQIFTAPVSILRGRPDVTITGSPESGGDGCGGGSCGCACG